MIHYCKRCLFPETKPDLYFDDDGVCDDFEIYGCIALDANNFNPEATEDDGSCDYSVDCDVLLLNISMHDSYGDG